MEIYEFEAKIAGGRGLCDDLFDRLVLAVTTNRLQLQHWHKGGPKIRLCVVGTEKTDSRFKQGRPDGSPVVLVLDKDTEHISRGGKIGILMSLQATGAQLCNYLAQLTDNNPAHIEVWLTRPGDLKPIGIRSDDRTLQERGVVAWSVVKASESLGSMCASASVIPEDRINALPEAVPTSHMPTYQMGGGDLTEEEMMRLAIQASLEDIGAAPPLGEEQKAATSTQPSRSLHDAPMAGFDAGYNMQSTFSERTQMAPNNSDSVLDWTLVDMPRAGEESAAGQAEKPKTPSTGTSIVYIV